ncbi:hypothetical protein GOP47_0007490 [Adiantum capillus-veneris]|uniref:Cationic amino acid transporter C-terminal domain-containing protein n=1 Tax=Adiantum capillus-veneris TaxID=13818 RepID=A0A9D4ZLK4_ADICA|nr:hypothetical protein GOP47_0007490 [Adiantum capillus-veneris]
MGFADQGRSSEMATLSWWRRRKHVDAKGRKSHQLAKTLSALQLIPIGVGSTIGAGVYVLVGTVAREKSGPALTLSFLIAGIAAACSAFCYAELASRCPSAGSAYHYSYICVGEGVAWLIGWALVLEYTVGGSAVARGISPNLALLIGGEDNLPLWLSRSTIPGTSIVIDPCAAVLVILVTILLCLGVKESAMVQAIITFSNVCVLIFVIIAGAAIGFETDWIGYRQADGFLPFGFNGMLGGAATVFFAYIGFDTVASTAEEVKHPQRDLPLGIGIALAICGSLYMLVSAVIVGIVPYTEIDVNTPMSSAFSRYGVQWAMYVVSAGAVAALSSTLMGSLLPQPRILMAMARDGLLPYFFLHVNKWSMVPINSTILTGVVAMLLAFFMNVDQLSGMVSVGTLLAFAVVSASILILRFVPPSDILTSFPYSVPSPNQLLVSDIEAEAFFQDSSGLQQDGSACPLLKEDQQKHGTPSDSTIPQENDQVSESKDEYTRRRLAAMGIGSSCIGALLVAVGASGDLLPSWLRYVLASIGAVAFSGGAITLSFLKQDEGRHTFGQSGGFLCPFVPWLPLLSILINVYLLANLGLSTWLRVGVWLILGAAVYFMYGIRHSLLSEKGRVAKDFAPLS